MSESVTSIKSNSYQLLTGRIDEIGKSIDEIGKIFDSCKTR